MANVSKPLRLLVFAVLALALAALLWVLFGALRSAIALWHEARDLPPWLQLGIGGLVIVVLLAGIWFGWRMLHPRRRKPGPVAAPTREQIDARVRHLNELNADTTKLQAELEELDRRGRSEAFYIAVFGEISAGKSSLVRALIPGVEASIDVLGGTTREVAHYRGTLKGEIRVVFADVPGTHEVGGSTREHLARDEALRAHIVLYVCNGDLTREQDAELRWLRGFGKPLLLVINKADQFRDEERGALESTLRERYRDSTDAQFIVSAGGTETFERRLADSRVEHVQRERIANIDALRRKLEQLTLRGPESLESSRQAAVLSAVGDRAEQIESVAREHEAEAAIAKYTKRAIVGALAAVMPGSDLVIQGVLASALIRELGRLYDVTVRDLDIDAFLGQVKLTIRTSTSLVLAIAGNALKAFPGLGTLGGGVLHAIAYGLIFDSLGHAVAKSMREQHRLDTKTATESLARLLADTSAERLRRVAAMAMNGDQDASN